MVSTRDEAKNCAITSSNSHTGDNKRENRRSSVRPNASTTLMRFFCVNPLFPGKGDPSTLEFGHEVSTV